MIKHPVIVVISILALLPGNPLRAQLHSGKGNRQLQPYYPGVYDSIRASRIPILHLPQGYDHKSLPSVIDNSNLAYFPPVVDQFPYPSCQQVCGVSYLFGYEINRKRNLSSQVTENQYPSLYTFSILNGGESTGVSFFGSFDILSRQGHMTTSDFGDTTWGYVKWISGYDKYYRGMHNRLKTIHAIPINTEEGILTMKNYLVDHLDGSATGGIAIFNASYNYWVMPRLPAGTPEAGKAVVLVFNPPAEHGMTIVGYNDSIRYDLNNDGKYTNDLDINGDGVVNVLDWEVGGFRLANSFGNWWEDAGFCYVLYSAMGRSYLNGGVWNQSVYVIDPEPDYVPFLTMKVSMSHNSRKLLKIIAGVSQDTTRQIPEQTMEFPLFSCQGGDHPMQGMDTIPESMEMEFGLDVTPLLSYVEPNKPTRFFFMAEVHDSSETARGTVHLVSFINYANGGSVWTAPAREVPVKSNDITQISVTGSVGFDKVHIATNQIQANHPGQPDSVRLVAEGGTPPYRWSLPLHYGKQVIVDSFPMVTAQNITPSSHVVPITKIGLPFSFPFHGKFYDTLYVNGYGMVTFDPIQVPFIWLADEMQMLKSITTICPAFRMNYYINSAENDGIWLESNDQWVCIRWKLSVEKFFFISESNFALRLHRDGRIDFLYGTFHNSGFTNTVFSGISGGDETNAQIDRIPNLDDQANTGIRFTPPIIPPGLSLTGDGLLTFSGADSLLIYSIPVRVTDKNQISDTKELSLSNGLMLEAELQSSSGDRLTCQVPASFRLTLTNTGSVALQNIQLNLYTADTSILVTDSMIMVSVLDPGGTKEIGHAFTFQVTRFLPDKYAVVLRIVAREGIRSWTRELSIPFAAPQINLSTPEILNGTDGMLAAGEVADLAIQLQNMGSADATGLELRLTSSDSSIVLGTDSLQQLDTLKSHAIYTFLAQIKAERTTLAGHSASFEFTVRNEDPVNILQPFTLQIGKIPVAIINLSKNGSSADSMATTLNDLGVPYRLLDSLPATLSPFRSVFLTLGVNTTDLYSLTQAENRFFSKLLENQGRLYMESYFSLWFGQRKSPLYHQFNYSAERVSLYYYTRIKGISTTFTDSMSFAYPTTDNFSLYKITPADSGFGLFHDGGSPLKFVQFACEKTSYKTIGSLLEFRHLTDSLMPSTKAELMRRYLEFFDINMTGPYPLFHTDYPGVCRWHSILFEDDSFDNIMSWQWEFPGGEPSLSNDKDPVVYYDEPGSFDVTLTVSDGIHSETIQKKDYIRVTECTGVTSPAENPAISVFPNPASERIFIRPDKPVTGETRMTLFNLMGQRVFEQQKSSAISGGLFEYVLPGLERGIYILHFVSNRFTATGKVILQ